MPRLLVVTDESTKVFELCEDFLTVGSAVGNQLRVDAPGVAPLHARILRTPEGYRVEPCDPQLPLAINGAPSLGSLLRGGDQVEVGDSLLQFDDGTAPDPAAAPRPVVQRPPRSPAAVKPPARPPAPAHPHPHHHHHHRHVHPPKPIGGMPPWALWSLIGVVGLVVLFVLLRVAGAGSYYKSAEEQLADARIELERGHLDAAYNTCQGAILEGASGQTRRDLEALLARIEAQRTRSADEPALALAVRTATAMEEMASTQPQDGARRRAAARELVRAADSWLQQHAPVCAKYRDTDPWIAKVRALRERYAPDARLHEPDDADDVMFAVDRRLAGPRPLYRDALQCIDVYLAAVPGDPRLRELQRKRDDVMRVAKEAVDRHEREARSAIVAGRYKEAREALASLRDAALEKVWLNAGLALEEDLARVTGK